MGCAYLFTDFKVIEYDIYVDSTFLSLKLILLVIIS
jgi:hypothetical protein